MPRTQDIRRLEWGDDLRTGLDVVDRQHERLIEIFNRLADGSPTEAGVVDALHDLTQYTSYHFRTEAGLMRRWNIDAAHRSGHLRAHQSFIDFLRQARALAKIDPVDVADHVQSFLAQWLLHHILGVDAALAREVAAVRSGADTAHDGAPATARPPRDTTRDRLVGTLSEVNDKLGRRTFEILEVNRKLRAEIARRERTEAGLQRLQELHRALLIAGEMLLSSPSEHDMLHQMCHRLATCRIFSAVAIVRPDGDGRFVLLAADGAEPDAGMLDGVAVASGYSHLAALAWERREAVTWNDAMPTDVAAPWAAALGRMGCRSLAAVPIERDGGRYAVLMALSAQTDGFDRETFDLIERIGEFLGHGLNELDLKRSLHDEQLRQSELARRDVLTGLMNRLALAEQLPRALAQARRGGKVLAVGMIDLDDFKLVNDRHGHEAGDALLRELGQRLQATLREIDFVARLGGDEFVIVIVDLDASRAMHQLQIILGRVHEVVEKPFAIAAGVSAEVGMSLGLALFPSDGDAEDTLLRKADAALYQAKTHKADRVDWWHLGAAATEQLTRESAVDPYCAEAAERLAKAQPYFDSVAAAFVEQFYDRLTLDGLPASIFRNLAPSQMQQLKRKQAEHLRFLLAPQTTRQDVLDRARRLGRIHALVGVSSSVLVQSMAVYRRLLSDHLNVSPMASSTRYRLLVDAESRIQDDIQAELEVLEDVAATYVGILSQPLPKSGAVWADASAVELKALGELPGILAAVLLRLDHHGILTAEDSAGPRAAEIADVLQAPGLEAVIDGRSERGQGVGALAWRTMEVQSTPSFANDPRYRFWQDHTATGIASILAVPIGADGHVVALLVLFGSSPNQFESAWMRQFGQSLRRRWEEIWSRCGTAVTADVVPQDVARSYRERLFAGGLAMYVQPVADLRSGAVPKVEALARLVLPDGSVVPPGKFLPLLGDEELHEVFRQGLDQSLAHVATWDAAGVQVDISVNMPPSTLLDSDCPQQVLAALRKHGIAPGRLTLELLESQTIEQAGQSAVIDRLVGLGVRLAMDDLGAGYSSLQRLSTLPFHVIKIDQGLLAQLRAAPLQILGLVGTLVQLGRDLDKEVIVEGLEDDAVIEAATHLGASLGQGYGIARPMPAQALPGWIRTFRLPRHGERISSVLGALAFHWRYAHADAGHGVLGLHDCPLTPFLAAMDGDTDRVQALHARIHAGDGGREASAELMDWLVDRAETAVPFGWPATASR